MASELYGSAAAEAPVVAIVDMASEDMNPELLEVELKYSVDLRKFGDMDKTRNRIIRILAANGFVCLEPYEVQNSDYYFDRDTELYHSGESMRIRTVLKDGKTVYKGTYKKPTGTDGARIEIELPINGSNLDSFREALATKLEEADISDDERRATKEALTSTEGLDLESKIRNINIRTNVMITDENGCQVCVSFDHVTVMNQRGEQGEFFAVEFEVKNAAELSVAAVRSTLTKIQNMVANITGLQKQPMNKYQEGRRLVEPSLPGPECLVGQIIPTAKRARDSGHQGCVIS